MVISRTPYLKMFYPAYFYNNPNVYDLCDRADWLFIIKTVLKKPAVFFQLVLGTNAFKMNSCL
jgi:hypothetical protein